MIVEKELILNVAPEDIYKDMSDVNFFNKICNSDKRVNIVYEQDRLIEYELNIKGVGKWTSQRIMIPEKLMFLTERKKPLEPFEYMVILNIYEKYGNATKFIYKEEFMVNADNIEKSDKIYSDISKVVENNMKLLKKHYGIVKERV